MKISLSRLFVSQRAKASTNQKLLQSSGVFINSLLSRISFLEIKLLEQDGLLSPLPVTDDSWQAWLQGMHDSHTQLKAALLGIPDDHDCREELVEWADRVGLFPVDEIDSVVLGECQDFSDPVLVRTAFSHRVQPPVTSRLLPLCVQMPRPGFQPRCIEDILKPWAIALMDMWFEAMLLTMQDMIA